MAAADTARIESLLSGLMVAQKLHTTAPEVYRALIEATVFEIRTIIDRFEQYGVHIKEVANCGGIAEKNAMVMQVYAGVCNRPMKISRSGQTCALGLTIFGAVVGGAYKTSDVAAKNITGTEPKVYRPIKKNAAVYQKLYELYSHLHNSFGLPGQQENLGDVMKQFVVIHEAV